MYLKIFLFLIPLLAVQPCLAEVSMYDDVKISPKTVTRPTPESVKERFLSKPEVKPSTPKIDFSKVTPIVHREPKQTEQEKIVFHGSSYKAPVVTEVKKQEEKPKAVEIQRTEVVEVLENKVVEEVKNPQKTPEPIKEKPVYKICGQVFNTYIIVEKDERLLMVDQHAAHERLRYEKLLAQYKERNIITQILLMPEIVSLTANEYSVFLENEKAINDLGYICESYGEREIIVREIPLEAEDTNVSETIFSLIEMFLSNRKNIDDDLASKMLYRIACRGAIKANKELAMREMETLLDNIFSLDNINTCPHGRPITIEFTKDFIEKQFKRIV